MTNMQMLGQTSSARPLAEHLLDTLEERTTYRVLRPLEASARDERGGDDDEADDGGEVSETQAERCMSR